MRNVEAAGVHEDALTEEGLEAREVMSLQMTEHDRSAVRLNTDTEPPGEPGVPGPRCDVDRDDSQMNEAASQPMR